jgi:dTMP kinase
MSSFPLFITCEGGEGSGKTTLIRELTAALTARGYDVVTTREPGGVPLGEQIRQFLLKRDDNVIIGSKAELLLFLAARSQHIESLIKPSLDAGKVVLCDRFNDSTIAYQGYARGLGMEAVQKLCTFVCNGVEPDMTFFLDVDPAEGLKRTTRLHKDTAAVGQVDRIEAERLEFHERVRTGMRRLAAQFPERIRTLDAHEPVEAVLDRALTFLAPLLEESNN